MEIKYLTRGLSILLIATAPYLTSCVAKQEPYGKERIPPRTKAQRDHILNTMENFWERR